MYVALIAQGQHHTVGHGLNRMIGSIYSVRTAIGGRVFMVVGDIVIVTARPSAQAPSMLASAYRHTGCTMTFNTVVE